MRLDRAHVERIHELSERGRTAQEIADALDLPRATVQQRITRERRKAKTCAPARKDGVGDEAK